MKRTLQTLALALAVMSAQALADAPLYQQRVEQARPDQEALQHSAELLRDHKDVKIQDNLLIQPFHKQSGELETAPQAFCRNCHGPLPHGKQARTRAFLNMHVRFIACETCHFRPKDVKFDYRWYDYQDRQIVNGEHKFRIGRDLDNSKQRPNNPKIAPFYQGQAVFALKDDAFGRDIAGQWDKAAPEQKTALRARVHLPLEKKGPECHACHASEQGLLDLPALGASPEQTQAIQKHMIPKFFRDYEKDDQKITIRNMLR